MRNPSSDMTESKLLLDLRNGQQYAFEVLYNKYKKDLIRHLLFIFKSDELTQDIVQETFISVWESRSNINLDKSFKAYLLTIATNKAYDTFRKANTDKNLHKALSSFIRIESNHVEDYITRKDQTEQFQELLLQMPEQQRRVFQLAKIEGYSYEEIAQKIGISRHTVNTHIKRANAFLRAQVLNRPELFFVLFSVLIEL